MIDPGTIVGGVGAISSLFGGKGKNRQSEGAMNAAGDILGIKKWLMENAGQLAMGYDPRREAQTAVDAANKNAGATLGASLKSLNTEFKNAGGSPGGDTLFDTNVDRTVKGTLDPLRMWTADKFSRATMDKLAALSMAAGSGGGLAEEYMKMSDGLRQDNSGAYGLLAGALDKVFRKPGAKGPASAKVSGIGGDGASQLPGQSKVRKPMGFAGKNMSYAGY